MRLSLLLISLLLGTAVFGQGRSCDIRANIITPNTGHTFISKSKQVVKVSLINEGPDTLRHGDDYSVKFRFGGVHLFPSFNSINRYIYPGDSIVYTDTLDIDYVGDLDSMPFCADVLFYNIGRDSVKKETPKQLANNTHCITTLHKRSNVSNRAILNNHSPLTTYPNPTTSVVNIECASIINTIVVTDQKGIVVRMEEDIGALKAIVNLSDLAQGVYFISIHTGDNVYTEKIIRTP